MGIVRGWGGPNAPSLRIVFDSVTVSLSVSVEPRATWNRLFTLHNVSQRLNNVVLFVVVVRIGVCTNVEAIHCRNTQRSAVRHDCVRNSAKQSSVVEHAVNCARHGPIIRPPRHVSLICGQHNFA